MALRIAGLENSLIPLIYLGQDDYCEWVETCDVGIGLSPSALVIMSFIAWYILFGLTLLPKCRGSELKRTKRLVFGFRHVTIV